MFTRSRTKARQRASDLQCSERSMPFRFLELSPELRNRIYHYAAYGDGKPTKLIRVSDFAGTASADDKKTSTQPSYYRTGLVQVCKQIRNEYLPISVLAPIAISWQDLENFQRHFYADASAIGNSPRRITVEVYDQRRPNSTHINCCPPPEMFLLLQAATLIGNLECKLVPADNLVVCERGIRSEAGVQRGCQKVNEFFKKAVKAWGRELSQGVFNRVETIDLFDENGPVEIELRDDYTDVERFQLKESLVARLDVPIELC